MRRYVFSLLPFMAACALGVAEDGMDPTDAASVDANTNVAKDSAAPLGHDASIEFDAGTSVDAGSDVAMPPTVDSSSCASTGTLVTYDFAGQPGNQTSTVATSSMSGITAGSVSRASTITAVTGANSINGSDWSSSLDTSRYYTFTLTPPTTCALDITSISIDTQASSTGPTSASVATSNDNFATTTSFTPGTTATVSLSVSGATKAVEVRIYGYGASGTGGTLRIESTLTASGSLM